MKILFCNKYNFPFSGTEVYLFDVMNLLREQGHEVALFSMSDPRGQATPYDSHFVPHLDFKDQRQSLFRRTRLAAHAIYSTDARRRLRAMIADFRPDVAHVRNIYHHLSPSILWELKARKIPVLYHLNDFKILCPAYNVVANGQVCEQPCRGRAWKIFSDGCYAGSRASAAVLMAEASVHYWLKTYEKCVDHFLVPSQFAKDMLVKEGFNSERISVLPHFQRLPEQVPEAGPSAPVLYFGRLSQEKGVADLIRAMAPLPHLLLKIAGDGPQQAELQGLVRELALSNVEFVGKLAGLELDRAISASRFTVLPSRAYETLGKSILESYAWAKPVIATDLGSRREVVQESVTGLLYPPGEVRKLSEAIEYLAQRPRLTAAMGQAGRNLLRQQFSPQAHYESLMQLYHQMCASARKPRQQVVQPGNRPLRVAFIGGRGLVSKYSGIETYYEEAGRRLAELGYEISVYCRSYFTPPVVAHNGMRVIRIPTIRSKHFETVLHTFLSTLHAMFSSVDIVHYHALGPALFSFLPRLIGKKTVVTVQGLDWQRKKWGRLASRVLRLGEMASVRLPHSTMVVSQTLREYYRQRYRADTDYIPNGARLRERKPAAKIADWGLVPDEYVLFLGRFSPEKNCHLLIEAFEKLKTPAKLVFAGGSSHTDTYAAELRKHASERIIFLDWVSGREFDELLTNAAVFVLPSDLEGLSLALLDAMGAGVCVLTSGIPENREVVQDAGFTFRPGDARDLEWMLGLLLSHPNLRLQAGRKARLRIQQQYLWPDIARQIGDIYEKALGEPVAAVRRATTKAAAGTGKPSERVA